MKTQLKEKDELKDINIDRYLDDLNHMKKSKELSASRQNKMTEKDTYRNNSPEGVESTNARQYSRSPSHFTRRIENLKRDIKYINNKPELKVETQILEKLDNLQLCLKQLESKYETEISALKEEIIMLRRKEAETPKEEGPLVDSKHLASKQDRESKGIKVGFYYSDLVERSVV